MKTIKLLALTLLVSTGAFARPVISDSLGLPGDNLDLYGVLDLFKKSPNPGEFEKALNKEDNKLNNLDLDGDGHTDYIHVIDRTEKNAHALVLQVAVNEKETQDVAVIEIEKNADGSAHLQIVGDEDLYGKDYIIEPLDENATKAAETPTEKTTTNVIVNVWGWPSVQYIYEPAYVVYVSPWGWHHYPGWWSPWRPVYWSVYQPYWYGYHAYHHRVYAHNVIIAHNIYYGHRSVSPSVYARRSAARSPAHSVNARPSRSAIPGPARREEHRMNNQQAQPRKEQAQPRKQQAPRQSAPRSQGRQNNGGHGGRRK